MKQVTNCSPSATPPLSDAFSLLLPRYLVAVPPWHSRLTLTRELRLAVNYDYYDMRYYNAIYRNTWRSAALLPPNERRACYVAAKENNAKITRSCDPWTQHAKLQRREGIRRSRDQLHAVTRRRDDATPVAPLAPSCTLRAFNSK